MTLRVRFTDEAEEDLLGAIAYLADRNLSAALSLNRRVDELLSHVTDGVLDGRPVTLSDGERALRLVEFPLIVYYVRADDEIVVLRVLDGRRRPIERGP